MKYIRKRKAVRGSLKCFSYGVTHCFKRAVMWIPSQLQQPGKIKNRVTQKRCISMVCQKTFGFLSVFKKPKSLSIRTIKKKYNDKGRGMKNVQGI